MWVGFRACLLSVIVKVNYLYNYIILYKKKLTVVHPLSSNTLNEAGATSGSAAG